MEVEEVIKKIKSISNSKGMESQAYFGIRNINNYGLTQPQIKSIAKSIGKDHNLALALWKTGIHEAKHIATLIADKNQVTEKLMEDWIKDFNSWDIVDGCCSALFDKSPLAWEKAIEWSKREPEFEKRAGFSLMAYLGVHDKKVVDSKFINFIPAIKAQSSDTRNFVKKAVNWAIRQIGKRNIRLCDKMIQLAKEIHAKGDSASKWIASDALRELEKYKREGRIKDVGKGDGN